MSCRLLRPPGGSSLGAFPLPPLPKFVDGPLLQNTGLPWGYRNASNCNPYDPSDLPNTGMTRRYEFTVTNTTLAPDGVSIPMVRLLFLSLILCLSSNAF